MWDSWWEYFSDKEVYVAFVRVKLSLGSSCRTVFLAKSFGIFLIAASDYKSYGECKFGVDLLSANCCVALQRKEASKACPVRSLLGIHVVSYLRYEPVLTSLLIIIWYSLEERLMIGEYNHQNYSNWNVIFICSFILLIHSPSGPTIHVDPNELPDAALPLPDPFS